MSASADGTVRVWALDLDDLLGIAEDNVTRGLTTNAVGISISMSAPKSDASDAPPRVSMVAEDMGRGFPRQLRPYLTDMATCLHHLGACRYDTYGAIGFEDG